MDLLLGWLKNRTSIEKNLFNYSYSLLASEFLKVTLLTSLRIFFVVCIIYSFVNGRKGRHSSSQGSESGY